MPTLKHGHAQSTNKKPSKTYSCWWAMMQRCFYPKNVSFYNYGAKGITVCERYKSFENFLADMGEKPGDLTLDRIDNTRGYEVGNLRWTSRTEQSRNRRIVAGEHGLKLTVEKVREINALLTAHSHTQRAIATLFGVSETAISRIALKRTWANVNAS